MIRAKPLKSPKPDFLTGQSCFLSPNWFYQCEHPLLSQLYLCIGSITLGIYNLYPSNKQCMLNKGSYSIHEEEVKETLSYGTGWTLGECNWSCTPAYVQQHPSPEEGKTTCRGGLQYPIPNESLYVSGKLPTCPSSKPTSTLTSHLGLNVGLGEEQVGRNV